MDLGVGIKTQNGRCFGYFVDLKKCSLHARDFTQCSPFYEDFMECLHHKKEVRKILKITFIEKMD